MILDLHTHREDYSPCSSLRLEQLILAEMERVDGIAITDHDHLLTEEEAEQLNRKYNFLLLPGVEISAEGVYTHILAFGIKKDIKPDLGVQETIAKIHEQGGIAIAAHPLRFTDDLDRREWRGIDCIETLTPKCSPEMNRRAEEISLEWRIPRTGSSDAHTLKEVGTYATKFNDKIRDVTQLKNALRGWGGRPIILNPHHRKRSI